MPETTEQLFHSWRQSGKPSALAAVYDRTAPRLLIIAAHLCTRPADAEDAVQSTFLEALQHSARWDANRPLEPWLLGILSNVVRRDARSRARRPAQPTGSNEAGPDPLATAASEELDSAVDHAIDQLPEVYRPVLSLRLKQGFEPADIATELSRAPGTVRSQLARGLELLRQRLPASFAAGIAVYATRSDGLAAIKVNVLEQASSATMATAATGIGTFAVKPIHAIAVALVLIIAGTGYLASTTSSDWSGSTRATPEITTTAARSPKDQEPAPNESEPAARTSAVLDGVAIVTVTCTNAPAANCAVRVRHPHSGFSHELSTNAAGQARFELPPGEYLATVFDVRNRFEVRAGETSSVDFAIDDHVRARVRTLDPRGGGAAGATVFWSSRHGVQSDIGKTDAAGYIEAIVPPGSSIGARHRHFAARDRSIPVEAPSHPIEIELQFSIAGGGIHGRVLSPDGEPVPNARVVAGLPAAQAGWREREGWATNAFEIRTSSDGTFSFFGLVPGELRLSVDCSHGAPWSELVVVEPNSSRELEIQLTHWVTVSGFVRDTEGSPREGVRVAMRTFGGTTIAERATESAEDGSYILVGLPAGRIRLLAGSRRERTWTTVEGKSGDRLEWHPIVSRHNARITGRVVDAAGQPVSGAFVIPCGCDHGMASFGSRLGVFRSGEDGSFDIGLRDYRHTDRTYDLEVFLAEQNPDGGWPETPPALAVRDIAPGTADLEIRIPDSEVPSAWIRGTIHGIGSGWFEMLDPEGGRQVVWFDKNGSYEHGPIPPRKFELRLQGHQLMGTVELHPRQVQQFDWTFERAARSRSGDKPALVRRTLWFTPANAPRTAIQLRVEDGTGSTVLQREVEIMRTYGMRAGIELPPGFYVVHAVDRLGHRGQRRIELDDRASIPYPIEIELN